MDRIVNQIVEYARPRELALAQFVLSELINEILKLLSGPLQAKHIKIRTSLAAAADHLHADRDQIEQVLLNVIDNAIEASPIGATIGITTNESWHHEQRGKMIRIRDAGTGMSVEGLSRVCEPCFPSGKPHGTGLGMTICKHMIERHHGDLHLTSTVGAGTIVSIWLPVTPEISEGRCMPTSLWPTMNRRFVGPS
jgi:signal transduction histidine kinase